MKCLSVSNPWAVLIVAGLKQHETRRWHTSYRGPLAIHASGRFPPAARGLCFVEPYRSALRQAGFDGWTRLPCGVMLGSVLLHSCVPVDELPLDEAAKIRFTELPAGYWVWRFTQPVRFALPESASGRLGLFDWEPPLSVQSA